MNKGAAGPSEEGPKMLPAFNGGSAWKRAACTSARSIFSLELAFQATGGGLCAQRKSSGQRAGKNIERGY